MRRDERSIVGGAQRAPGRPPFRRILVPLDGSDRAAEILPDAAGLARLTGGELVLAQVQPPGGALAGPAAGPAALERQAAAIGRPRPPVSIVVLRGDPAEQLVGYARDEGIDLVAMATRGAWDWPGSVAEAVARAAPVPVLVRRVPAAAGRAAFVGPQRVLVPLDGAPTAEAALPAALALAAATGGSLLLIRVVDRPGGAFPTEWTVGEGPSGPELRAAHAYLAAVVAARRRPGVPMEATVRLGSPAETVAWAALDAGVDLVVAATEGGRDVGQVGVGGVARGVLRRLGGPLLLVPAVAAPVPGPPARRP